MSNEKKDINDGGSAFPTLDTVYMGSDGAYYTGHTLGLTMRDYFAAKAMAQWMQFTFASMAEEETPDANRIEAIAPLSYALADAMLKAREQ